MRRRWLLLGLIAVLLLGVAGGMWSWRAAHSRAALRIVVPGGDAGGLPIAAPADEHFDPVALERVPSDPAATGLQALIVMRHGHIVYSRYGDGVDADTVIDSGPFARVLPSLLAGVALQQRVIRPTDLAGFDPARVRVAIENGAHQSYADYLSHKLWSRLNAASAWIRLPAPGAATPVDCCFEARVQDWMRIGGLLVNDGNFEGTQIVGRGWIARMRAPMSADGRQGLGVELAASTPGVSPFAARDVFFLRGSARWRLWVVPSLQLAVLFGASAPSAGSDANSAASDWDEARVPNGVMQALLDRPVPATQTKLQQLVPGH